MTAARVILIGGAPLVGKTTIAIRLAARLGYACLSTDDLGTAVRAVTTPASHPILHPMAGQDYRDYYIQHPHEKLIDDAEKQHQATWPAIAAVIKEHATWRVPAVIEGWGLRPEWVSRLGLRGVGSLWLIADEMTLRQRLLADKDFLKWARDEQKLVDHFVARSLWYNRMVQESASRSQMRLISTVGISPDETCEQCWGALG